MMMRTVVLLALASLAASAQAQPTDVAVARSFDISCYMDYVTDGFAVVKDALSEGNALMAAVGDLVTDIKTCYTAEKKVVCLGQAIRDGWEDNEKLRDELLELAEKIGTVFSKSCKAPKMPVIRNIFDLGCYVNVFTEAHESFIEDFTRISQQIAPGACTNPLTTKCLVKIGERYAAGHISEELKRQFVQSLKDVTTILDDGLNDCITS